MALFGTSKKEKELAFEVERQATKIKCQMERTQQLESEKKELEAEIERLKPLVCPEKIFLDELENKIQEEKKNYEKILDDEEEAKKQIEHLKWLQKENRAKISKQEKEIIKNDAEIEIQTFGLYEPTYEFANSDLYKEELKKVRDEQKKLITSKKACVGNAAYCKVNDSQSQGIKMLKGLQKLLLRAFNTECDNIVANVKISNYDRSIAKMEKARSTISECSSSLKIEISDEYLELKKKELSLALDFAIVKHEEKERIRELKAQEREAAKAQKEIEEARKKLLKEQAHYQNAMQMLLLQLEKEPDNQDLIAKKVELEADIADTQKAIEDVDYREANRRAGYVYVISNIGAFGKDVYKIGMTRRLEPMDRVNELGDASVPFNFDVHALIFTEDAPTLESALHKAFDDRKVNKVNTRREFFKVSLDEIKKVVRENFDKTVEWVDIPEAEQYRQSLLMK